MDTIAAIATATGGAIGIIRLSGDMAVNAVNNIFKPINKKQFSDMPSRMLVYGNLYDRFGNMLDSCMAVHFDSDKTYTGEQMAELQLHGSPAVLSEALSALFEQGVRQADAGEFTRRAFLNGKMNLMQAEAVSDLIAAHTLESAHNAVGQISGTIANGMDELRQKLIGVSAHFLAVVDYPDEDIDPFLQSELKNTLTYAENKLHKLRISYEQGRILREGLPCAIVGRPNVGKSTLLNALVGFERAIVTDIAGTTRDTIEEVIRIGSLTLRLQDTAGIRESEDIVEQIGVERAKKAVDEAELVLAVVDGSTELTKQDINALDKAKAAKLAILVINKSDKGLAKQNIYKGFEHVVEISAKQGEGIDKLRDKILSVTGMNNVVFDGGVITNARQADALNRAEIACRQARNAAEFGMTPDAILQDVESAISALGELTGQSVRDDIIQDIFSRFCVGK